MTKKQEQEKVWNEIAGSWGEYRQLPLKQVEEFLARKRKGKILDLGCGTGRNFVSGCQEPPVKDWWHEDATLRVVLDHYQNSTSVSNHSSQTSGILKFKFYGVDFSKEMVKLARKKDYVKVVKSEVWNLPFKNNYFNYALYIATLHCIPDKEKREASLAELRRVLKPRGKALISVWDKKTEKFAGKGKEVYLSWGLRHENKEKKIKRYYYLYDKQEFLKLLKKYFKIVKIFGKKNYKDASSRRFAKRNIVVEIEK